MSLIAGHDAGLEGLGLFTRARHEYRVCFLIFRIQSLIDDMVVRNDVPSVGNRPFHTGGDPVAEAAL